MLSVAAVTVVIRHPRSFAEERSFAFDAVLADGLGLPWRSVAEDRLDVELSLEGCATGKLVLPDVVFSNPEANWPASLAFPEAPLETLKGPWIEVALSIGEVPVLFGRRPGAGGWLEDDREALRFGVDIFGSAFVLLSRVEELRDVTRDDHDRFPAAASIAVAHGFLDRPLVDEYVELLRALLVRIAPGLRSRRPAYAEDVTHDIDYVDARRWGIVRELRASARNLVSDHAPAVVARRLASIPLRRLLGPRCDIFNTFAELMRLSEEHGLKSTFFFIAGNAPGGLQDDNYLIDEPWLRQVLRAIDARGHDIGLHGSYQSFASAPQLAAELEALERVLREEGIEVEGLGCRQHYLRFDPATTWPAQAAAGLSFDSTVGFAEVPGFRSGTSREHGVFDVVERVRLPLRERPLTLMDSTLLDRAYLNLDRDEAGARAEHLKRACRRVGGTFRLLWHNTTLVTSEQRSLYRDILAC